MSIVITPPPLGNSLVLTPPVVGNSVTITPSNPANKITLSPPSGGNPITIYAGIAGPTGPQGATGPATTLSVGGTTTGSPGSNASVSLSGNSPSQTMYFTIPSGVKGDTGATGPSNTLSVGGTTTGTPGSSAIVSLSGSSPNQYLYTTIPAGIQGSTGATGASPTLSVNSLVGSVAYGQQAKASLSGTATNPVLNLTLQSGQQGATGPQGNTGATGASPTLSVNSLVGSVPSGAQGSASLSGTATNPVLNLTLPAGLTGQTGSTGATGAGYDGVTSSSSIQIPSSPSPGLQFQRTLTVNKTGAFAVGSRIILSATVNPQIDWMGGTISAISGNNWTVYIDVKGPSANGTYSSWTVSVLGASGTNGTNGSSPTLSVNSNVDTLSYGNNGIASLDNTNTLDPVLYLTLPAGPQGTPGSDASVTSANITAALGYTPIGDAPDTLHQYARTKGAWQTISGGGGTNYFTLNGDSDIQTNTHLVISPTYYLSDSLQAYWTFDTDTLGNVILTDSTSNHVNFTVAGGDTLAPAAGTGIIGGCAVGDGVGYYYPSKSLNLSGDFTINYWLVPSVGGNPVTGNPIIFGGISNGSGFVFTFSGDNDGTLYYGNSAPLLSYNYGSDSGWHMATLVRANGQITMYFDGSPVSSAYDSTDYSDYFSIFAFNDGSSVNQSSGISVDEMGVWGFAISQSAIQNLYNGGAATNYSLFSLIVANPEVDHYPSLIPENTTQNLGTPSFPWGTIYANNSVQAPRYIASGSGFESGQYQGGSGSGTKLDEYGNFQFGSGFTKDSGHAWLVCMPNYQPNFFSIVASSSAGPGLYDGTFIIAPYVGGDGNGKRGAVFTARNTLDDGYGNAKFSKSVNLAPIERPSSPVAGQIYFDSGDSHFYGYNGSGWVQLDN